MIIELRGVEFVNKGAELMLHAIIEQISVKYPNAVFVMEKNARTPISKLQENHIYLKLNSTKFGIPFWKLGYALPKAVRRKLGFVLENEINVILDGSGFAYGDQWGNAVAVHRLGSKITDWKKSGKKVVLLPQAFGPFEKEDLRKTMSTILKKIDLIFAREQQSFKYLKAITSSEKLYVAPDFTNLSKGRVPANFTYHGQVGIIPNYKMVEKSTDSSVYLNFLKLSIDLVVSKGYQPYFLIHEGQRDINIAQQVNTLLTTPLEIVTYDDPLEIKGVISTAKYIICSRFHGVVSALSQGIPCLVTSWSHKYEMLMSEYEFKEGIIKDLGDESEIIKKVGLLSEPLMYQEIADKLGRNAKQQKERSKQMWQIVYDFIGQ